MRIRKLVCVVTILLAIFLAAIFVMLAFRTRQENQSGVPDIVNSTRLNDCEHLTVVANRRDIADKEAWDRCAVTREWGRWTSSGRPFSANRSGAETVIPIKYARGTKRTKVSFCITLRNLL